MRVLKIFVRCNGYIYGCRGDIYSVSWRYLMGVAVLEIFHQCPGDI